MKKIKEVSYADVLDFFIKEHPIDLDSPHFAGNKWGRLHLEQANTEQGGVWSLCELEPEDILNLVIPHHEAEDGKDVFVEESGLVVRDALAKLENNLQTYAENNPVCWNKIMYWQGKDFFPLFLSTKPATRGRRSHVDPSLGSIFHLDGLHRLMRWGLDGRFNPKNYNKGEKLTAYVAGFK